jgi:hypothetical protein
MSQMATAEVQKQLQISRASARGGLRRKCEKCREKEKILQRSLIGSAPDSTRFGQDFSQIPIHSRSLAGIQTKLTVNTPGDAFEQEADRVADEVMRIPPGEKTGLMQKPVAVNKVRMSSESVQRQLESPDKQGDCSGWERDCESFCRRAAEQYWRDIGVSPIPIAPGPVECDTPFIGPDGKLWAGMCHLHYKNGVTVTVARSLHGGKNLEVWQTKPNDKTKSNEYSGPICDYQYYCTKKQSDLILEKKFCYDPRTEERPKEKEQAQGPGPSSLIQRSATHESALPQAPPMIQDVLNSPGQALDTATSSFMENRFGHDFSGVRIHTDPRAAQSARAIAARAYTVGNHIVFGESQFDSSNSRGRRLLSHELAHVVQQRSGSVYRQLIQRSLIPYRQINWTDFKATSPSVSNPQEGAEIKTKFDLMPTYSPVTTAKRTKVKCGKGRARSTEVEATSAPDPADFGKPEAQMDQDNSWAMDRYTGNGTNYCTDLATTCEKDFDDAPTKIGRTCRQAADVCESAFKQGKKSFGQYFDNTPVTVTREADCMTTFLRKCQQLLIRGFSVTERGATARTKADCRGNFYKQCLVDEVAERARLLKHEQGHFDITNVIAKNARESAKAMAATLNVVKTGCGEDAAREATRQEYNTNVSGVLIQLGKDWISSRDQAQTDYDHETGNGGKAAEQRAWEAKITGGLKAYGPASVTTPATPPATTAPAKPTPAPKP